MGRETVDGVGFTLRLYFKPLLAEMRVETSAKRLRQVFIVLGAYIASAGGKLPSDADGSLNPLFLCELASTGEIMIDALAD